MIKERKIKVGIFKNLKIISFVESEKNTILLMHFYSPVTASE